MTIIYVHIYKFHFCLRIDNVITLTHSNIIIRKMAFHELRYTFACISQHMYYSIKH